MLGPLQELEVARNQYGGRRQFHHPAIVHIDCDRSRAFRGAESLPDRGRAAEIFQNQTETRHRYGRPARSHSRARASTPLFTLHRPRRIKPLFPSG